MKVLWILIWLVNDEKVDNVVEKCTEGLNIFMFYYLKLKCLEYCMVFLTRSGYVYVLKNRFHFSITKNTWRDILKYSMNIIFPHCTVILIQIEHYFVWPLRVENCMLPKHFNLVLKSQIMVNSLFSKSKKVVFLVEISCIFLWPFEKAFWNIQNIESWYQFY